MMISTIITKLIHDLSTILGCVILDCPLQVSYFWPLHALLWYLFAICVSSHPFPHSSHLKAYISQFGSSPEYSWTTYQSNETINPFHMALETGPSVDDLPPLQYESIKKWLSTRYPDIVFPLTHPVVEFPPCMPGIYPTPHDQHRGGPPLRCADARPDNTYSAESSDLSVGL